MNDSKAQPSRMARRAGFIAVAGFVIGLLAALGMLLAGPLYRMDLAGLRQAFGLMGLGAKTGVVAIILGLVWLILAMVAKSRRGSWLAALGVALGLLAFVPPWMFMHKARLVPPIHDISTDTTQPPAFRALLEQRKSAPNSSAYGGAEIASQQHKAYPDIKPMQLRATAPQVFAAALATARDMDWAIAAKDPSEGRIEATATTLWFGFKDDVVIRIRAQDDGDTRLDIRSLSRVGQSDVGKNAERIRSFEKKLREALSSS
ncbi:MAG: DUF1499 domain-containing protein [Rhodanobacteraceae bacterium]